MHCQIWSAAVPDRPLLMLHGFMGSGLDFANVICALGDRHSCLTLDLPGHGQTLWDGSFDMPTTAAKIIATAESLTLPPATLCGYSLGGRIALYLALHYPERFPRVILESASPGLQDVQQRRDRQTLDHQRAAEIESDFPGFVRRWYEQPLFASLRERPDFEAMVQGRSQHRDPQGLGRSLREVGSGVQPSLWRKLAQHRQPILAIVGERDLKFRAIAQAMQTASGGSFQVKIIPNAGHNVHLEQPQAFAEAILSWEF